MAIVVAFPSRRNDRFVGLLGQVIRRGRDGFDVATVLEYAPREWLDEYLAGTWPSAQAWWNTLARRSPDLTADVLRRLVADGHAFPAPRATRTGRRGAPMVVPAATARTLTSDTGNSVMAAARRLDPEELGSLIDQLIGYMSDRYNIAHP